MKVNFSALFSRTPTYPYLGQKSLYLSPLYFARRGLGNSGIFLIDQIPFIWPPNISVCLFQKPGQFTEEKVHLLTFPNI